MDILLREIDLNEEINNNNIIIFSLVIFSLFLLFLYIYFQIKTSVIPVFITSLFTVIVLMAFQINMYFYGRSFLYETNNELMYKIYEEQQKKKNLL